MNRGWKERVISSIQLTGLMLIDAVVMAIAYISAFILRLDFAEPWWGWKRVTCSFIVVWGVQTLALTLSGCYRLLWRYISASDLPRYFLAISSSTFVLIGLRALLPHHHSLRPPYSITFLNAFLVSGALLGIRLLWRLITESERNGTGTAVYGKIRLVLLVGAGSAGNLVARELRRQTTSRLQIVGFLDDDPSKQHARIQGYPVLGQIDDLPETVRRYGINEVIVSMARVSRDVIRRVVMLCEKTHVPARIVPGYFELIEGTVTASKIRNLDVADLLGRDEIEIDTRTVMESFGGKRVLITGAGGSIGSELARQILRTSPEQLILVERSENALYEIDRELCKKSSTASLVSVLADVGDRKRMTEILSLYRPQMILHAAACKHVPLSERNPIEALKNNALATRLLGELAMAHGVDRFVLISTDKAVNPLSVMGATKRMAEILLQDLNRCNQTRFSAVRFGNVLDSSGSVVPLFREQIRKGEPVTVTHPEMRRYFMTISEAVSLVLQAAALAQGGEIFVLDMGEPIRILDLAEEMIALSGLRPYEDIPIRFTGVRPGEKLFEELDVSEKSAYRTGHARIFISKIEKPDETSVKQLLTACERLVSGSDQTHVDRESILTLVQAR